MRCLDIASTLLSYFLLLIFGIVLSPIIVIFLLLPNRWRYQSRLWFMLLQLVYWLIVRCSFLSVKVIGKRNIPREPAIIAVNHESSFDIPLVGFVMNSYPHFWLALANFFNARILRYIVSRVAVPVDMSSLQRAARSLIQSIELIRDKKMHAIIFPEGGRYTDGTVHDFYSGFVMLAKRSGSPVVPIYLKNVGKAFPPGAFFARRYPITITVGKAMMMQEGETDEAFKERVYAWFVEQSER